VRSDAIRSADALAVYRKLVLARRAEETIREEYFKDEMKTPVHLGIGAEAISVGVCHGLPGATKVFGTYRNHALYLALTGDTDGFFAELYGKITGAGKGKAGSMHLSAPERGLVATSAVVGTTIPVGVGAALAHAYQRSDELVAVFFGDGAVEEGVFWESLNFASLRRLRDLLVCEDNGLAIHAPAAERQGFRSIVDTVRPFQCHVVSGDGSDVEDVIATTRRVLALMAEDPRPGFLHFGYFRFLEHVGPREDFDAGYRRRPTPDEARRLDPVVRFEERLRQRGIAEAALAAVGAGVDEQISRSVRAAREAQFPSAAELYRDVFA